MHDLGALRHRVFERRAPRSGWKAFYSNNFSGASVMATVLGEGDMEALDTVDATLLEGEATGFAFATKGVMAMDGEEILVERAMGSDLDAWKSGRAKDLRHVSLLATTRMRLGKQKLDLAAAVRADTYPYCQGSRSFTKASLRALGNSSPTTPSAFVFREFRDRMQRYAQEPRRYLAAPPLLRSGGLLCPGGW